jgi:hypothetical protein
MAIQQLLASYGAAAPAFTYATWNPADKSGIISLSGGDLIATRDAGTGWAAVRATIGKNSGKWYFEITRSAGSDKTQSIYGLIKSGSSLSNFPGSAAGDVGCQPFSTASVNRYSAGFLGTVAGQSDVAIGGGMQFAVDASLGRIWAKTFGAAGWIGGGDPAANTTPTFAVTATTLFPAFAGNLAGVAGTANFGASAFVGTVPSGFNPGWYT